MERELTAPVDLADAEGRLRPEAIGWARHPLHRIALPRGLPRVHAFDYWCVTNREVALTMLVADVGFAGVAMVSLQDLGGGAPVERIYVRPRGLPAPMPPGADGEVAFEVRRLRIEVGPRRLAAQARTLTGRRLDVDLAIEPPAGHETINVVVPWSETRYHVTSKQQALPARGTVRLDGRSYRFGADTDGFACRDFGRGRWPDGIDWRWAFASTRIDGRPVGFNLGAGWTDTTPVTENGLVIDGRVHKLGEAVAIDFDPRAPRRPWRLRTVGTRRVDLTFTPLTLRPVHVPPVFRLRQCMGRYDGTIVDDAGRALRLDGALGLAESVHGRW
ncbi:MAG: DUF2804 domain-containing protein [Myxococcales bacterium]|nr:DUF2804 domain-containing protein [Myxococcales bacterium]